MTESRVTNEPVPDWDEERSRSWLSDIDSRERQLEPVSDALFERAALQPGEAVLDVGCGSGVTTARAAALVVPEVSGHSAALEETGRVVGNDVSTSMIAAARERFPRSAIEWVVADAQTHDFEAAAFDVVISRFGLMFFADPAAAFANLAAATRPGGRLTAVVWQNRSAVDYFAVPLGIVLDTLERLGAPPPELPADDSGPFGLSDPAAVHDLLTAAGWSQVWCQADHRPIYCGGPGSPDHAARSLLSSGVIESALAGQPAEVVDEVGEALTVMARERHDGAGVPLATALWILTATRAV